MIRNTFLLCLLSVFVLLTGCQPEGDGDGGSNNGQNNANNGDTNNGQNNGDTNNGDTNNGDTNNGDNNGEANNGGVELPPCEGNTDCRGGEVCREGFCREACAEQDPCTGPLGTCDVEQGYCVGCLSDEDCGDNEACGAGQLCAFFCQEDAACAQGEFCAEDGSCQEAQCAVDADCPGGFRCEGSLCEAIDDLVCTPDSSRCEENMVVSCSRDGTREEREDCQEELCVNEEAGARCVPRICEPNSIGCQDEATAYTCNSQGTERQPVPCGEAQVCQEGVCRTLICEPGAVTCQGDARITCAEDGLSQQEASCEEACDGEQGCTCQEGACVARICAPGSAQCVGNAVRTCDEAGLGYEPLALCQGEEVCLAGGCVNPTCQPGQTECAGDTLLTCSQDGTQRGEVSCQGQGAFCGLQDGQATCIPHICQPGEALCQGEVAAMCNARGNGPQEGVVDCAAQGQICQAGRCVATCGQEGARRCQGNTVLVCQEDRVNEEAIACAAGRRCEEGQCVAQFCTPNEPACDGQRAVVCDSLGSAWRNEGVDCSAQDKICQSGRCVDAAPDCPVAQARVRLQGTSAWTQQLEASPLRTVELDATTSQGAVSYSWSLVGRPQGSNASLSSATASRPTLFLDLAGSYVIELDVQDAQGEEACQTSRVSIRAVSDQAINIQLTWTTPGDDDNNPQMGSDLDLHLLHPNGTWEDARWDCFWRNTNPDWGASGAANDPSQDIDDVNGDGPENISLDDPENLNYEVGVYYYEDNNYGSSYASLRIWLNGVLSYNMEDRYLERDGLFWHVAQVRWFGEEGDVQQVNALYPSGFPNSTPGCTNNSQCGGDNICVNGSCQAPPSGDCTDRYEPNNNNDSATSLPTGTTEGLTLCEGDEDWYTLGLLNTEVTAVLEYTPTDAQVTVVVYDSFLGLLELGRGTGSNGRVEINATTLISLVMQVYSDSPQDLAYSIQLTQ